MAMPMRQALRQMPAKVGRAGAARGEAARDLASDEACGPRHEPKGTGLAQPTSLVEAALTRENYGFRHGRRAQDPVLAARAHVQSGRRIVVGVDLEKYFDRVNHDVLIVRLQV